MKKNTVEKICRQCNATFILIRGVHRVNERIFCSRACARPLLSRLASLRIGDKSPRWKGGERFERISGRFIVRHRGRDVQRARVVVEKALGRILSSCEIVHHINGDKTNDTKENLFLFRHQKAHVRWHLFLKRHGLLGTVLTSNV